MLPMIDAGQLLSILLSALAGAFGAYLGVRIELAVLRGRIDAHEKRLALLEASERRAHERIDEFVMTKR